MSYYIYVYLDSRKSGSYSYGEYHFEYEPFYVGKGVNDRYLTHLRIANGTRKGKNNLIISKIKSILSDGYEPIIIKIEENLTKENYSDKEINAINIIGKVIENKGPLLNITDGGDGGITWSGDHHNKGKKLEEIVGVEKSIELKKQFSINASIRFSGEGNPMYGKRGKLSPIYGDKNINYGKERNREVKNKISNTLKKYNENLSPIEKEIIIEKIRKTINNTPQEIKQEWYDKISKKLKEKKENGELFTEEHRQKLKDTNWKKLNKGSDYLKLSDETKNKISNSLKNRVFSDEHRSKLRKCITFEEFELVIVDMVENKIIDTITKYRKYAKDNPDSRLPIRPEKSYKNYGWEGWRKYGL